MIRVKRQTGFEDTIAEMNQLPHNSDVDSHTILAARFQPHFEGSDNRIPTVGGERRHEEHSPEMGVTPLDQAASAAEGGTRMPLAGSKAGKGSYLRSVGEASDIRDFSEENGSRCVPDTRDGKQQRLVVLQVRVLVNVLMDMLRQFLDLLIKERNVGINAGCYLLVGNTRLAPVALALPVYLQCLPMARHRPQGQVSLRGACPGVRLLFGAVVSDGARVFPVRLVPLHRCLSMTLDQLGIDDTDGVSLLIQEQGQLHPVAAGGFHRYLCLSRSPLLEPMPQPVKATLVIVELAPVRLRPAQDGDIEAIFGNVNPYKIHLFSPFLVDGRGPLQDKLVNGSSLPLPLEGLKISHVLEADLWRAGANLQNELSGSVTV